MRRHNEGSIFRRKRGGKWTAAVSMPDARRVERECPWHDNSKERAKELLPRVGLHGLRHTSLTLLADAGVPEDVRMRRAGHSTTQMARRYTSGADAQDNAAAAALNIAIRGKA